MKTIYTKFTEAFKELNDLSLLLIRLVLAYGFYGPATMKLKDIHAIGDWLSSMNYPLPYFNVWMATIIEVFGIILLTLGLGIQLISIPLMIVMLVALLSVHLGNGFEAGNNGFEIPLYYLLMLFVLLTQGAGKYSIDQLINKKTNK